MTKSPNRSTKKTFIAGAGLALMIPSTFAGAANALTTSEAKPLEYKGAVTAEDYGKSTYEIPVDYASLDAIAKAAQDKGVKVTNGETKTIIAANHADGLKKADEAKKDAATQVEALKKAVATVEQNKLAEAKAKADEEAAKKIAKEAEAVKAENAKITEDNKAITAENEKIKAENEAAKKDADAKNAAALKAYNDAKAAQDKLKAEQVTNADPNKAIVDAKNLAVEQPFDVVDNDK